MPVKSDREYRDIDMRNMETRIAEDGQYIVEGYATTFGEPYLLFDDGEYRFYESFDAHAFDNTDLSDVIMQYDHAGHVYARGSNGTLLVKPDNKGLFTRGYLGGTQIGKQLYEEIHGGYTTRMSHGFRVKRQERRVVENQEAHRYDVFRTILEVQKEYDVSAVSLPANGMTEIHSARSYCEGVIAEVRGEIAAEKARARIKSQINIIAGGI